MSKDKVFTQKLELENNTTRIHASLSSMNELMEIASAKIDQEYSGTMPRNSILESSCEFNGRKTLPQTIQIYLDGWKEGMEKLASTTLDIKNLANRVENLAYKFSDSNGLELDIGLFLSGEPECWIKEPDPDEEDGQSTKKNKIVPIAIPISYYCMWNTDQIFRRGQAIISIIDGIEATGRQCELFGILNHNKLTLTVPLKKAGEYISPERIIYTLGHPSFLRRILFSLLEHTNKELRNSEGYTNNGSYSSTREISSQILAQLPELKPLCFDRATGENILLNLCSGTGSNPSTFSSDDSALKWTLQTLQTHGVQIELSAKEKKLLAA